MVGLTTIERAVFDLEQLTMRSFQRYLGLDSADLIVADWRGELIGYGLASYRKNAAGGRLLSIAVATRATGRGVGTTLLCELDAAARRRGAGSMQLEVRSDNRAALSLYARAGYRQIGLKPAYYADFCDAIVMKRLL